MRDQEEIHSKGFDFSDNSKVYRSINGPVTFGSLKLNDVKDIDDAFLNLGTLPKVNRHYGDKLTVLRAMASRNLPLMRDISDYFYRTSGVYMRVCNYFSQLYRFDWLVVPEVFGSDKSVKTDSVKSDLLKLLGFLDDSHIKEQCGKMSLEVIKHGAYYGYLVPSKKGLLIQQLPANYCRSHHYSDDLSVVEFDMRFFDDQFPDVNYRMKVLQMFPKEFQIGYRKFKKNLITEDGNYPSRRSLDGTSGAWQSWGVHGKSWYPLDPKSTIRIVANDDEQPLFIQAIPSILDLDAGQELNRKKAMQQLCKLIIQKLPLDKNGELIFDIEEAKDLHENVKQMLRNVIGSDVITTFADLSVEELADTSSAAADADFLDQLERTVYNNIGTSRNLFNTDGNLSMDKSIADDESIVRNILFQFTSLYDRITQQLSTAKKYRFRFHMLETTQYNYKDLAKFYKENVQLGYSKMLPQIAMGQSQSFILHMAYFENDILKLTELMIPPLQSSVMNSQTILGNKNQSGSSTSQKSTEGQNKKVATVEKAAGRPEKPDDQKSDKTIANKESM